MSDLVVQIGVAALSSVVTSSAVAWGVKTWLKQKIADQFARDLELLKSENAKLLAHAKSELDLTLHAKKSIFEQRFKLYPQLVEQVYRFKRSLLVAAGESGEDRDFDVKALRGLTSKTVDALQAVCFENRFIVSKHVFAMVHELKTVAAALDRALAFYKAHPGPRGAAEIGNCIRRIRYLADALVDALRAEALIGDPVGT